MKKEFKSISWKIWSTLTRTIMILFIMVLLANITIIKNIKDNFILSQLEDSAEVIINLDSNSLKNGEMNDTLNAAIFRMEKNGGDYSIILNKFSKSLFMNKNGDNELIDKIVSQIIKNGVLSNKGIVKENSLSYYYYIDWSADTSSALVFLTSSQRETKFQIEIFIIILFFLIISFFTSRITAKKIAEPIEKLELFAEEIAKRNWNAQVPKTDPDEIGLLANALEKMRDSLKISQERDRQFLQSTSHDLKTPVMIIKGYAQSLLDGVGVDSEISAAEVIKNEAERLERRITQLLKLNTLSHSLEYSENREFIRLDRLLKSLISKFMVVRPELNWNLTLKELEMKGDPEALLIAFENILENQLRYAKNSISIKMNVTDKSEIIISNDGSSFELDDPMVIFEPYKKDRSGKFGLGLAIVKQVIESHKGSIVAYNVKNGVEFKINF